MAITQIADLIQTDEFRALAMQESTHKSAFFRTGAIANNGELSNLINANSGNMFQFGWFNQLPDRESAPATDDATLITPEKITTGSQWVIRQAKTEAWSVADLARVTSATKDPLSAIARAVGGYWARQYDNFARSIISGVVGDNVANDGGDMVHNVYSDVVSPGPDNYASITNILDTKQTMGDHKDKLQVMIAHSKVVNDLEKTGYVDRVYDDSGSLLYKAAAGMPIIESDFVLTAAGTNAMSYYSYFCSYGYLQMGLGRHPRPEAIQLNEAAGTGFGIEEVYSRRIFAMSPMGFSWAGSTAVNDNPDAAALAAAASWDRVVDRKNSYLAVMISN